MHRCPIRFALLAACYALSISACGDDDRAPHDARQDAAEDARAEPAMACLQAKAGCPCSSDELCIASECVGGVCDECRRGSEHCTCRANGSCDAALRCSEGLCELCEPGMTGCACRLGAECDDGLGCMEDVCAALSCEPGGLDCPCRDAEPRCDDAAVCDANGSCRACGPDMVGCPCDEHGACSGGHVCDGGRCRAPISCAQRVEHTQCDARAVCSESRGRDAECSRDSCIAGYVHTSGAGCVKCVSSDCAAEPSCDSGPNSIAARCTAANRSCEDLGGSARCGGCLPASQMAGDACVAVVLCGDVVCAADEYCQPDKHCRPLPCPAGQALDTGGTCKNCSLSCKGGGLTGRIWPFQTADDNCICETGSGYYMPPGGTSDATLCDADHDGWVRQEADDAAIRLDRALRPNARCDVRRVDGVVLRDEYMGELAIGSCVEGLIQQPSSATCSQRVPMRLLETQRNDTPGKPVEASRAPAYGSRELNADELNGLTKFCVNLLGDYNDNGTNDIAEVQDSPGELAASADEQRRLASFAYFGELYHAYYRAAAQPDQPGQLMIEERSRCDRSQFALAYDADARDYAADQPTTYWRNCARNRDPSYDAASDEPGDDFAQWSCQAQNGTCPLIGPAHPSATGQLNVSDAVLRDQGLCELGGSAPADRTWRGLNHHSQFKCVQVTSITTEPYQRQPTQFAADASLVLNLCKASGTRPTHDGAPEREPLLECTVAPGNPPAVVGFAALRYRPYGREAPVAAVGCGDVTCALGQYCDATSNSCKWGFSAAPPVVPLGYQGGCVNETVEWGNLLCPTPDFSRTAEVDAFGRYSCYGDSPYCLLGAASARSVLVAAGDESANDPEFCNNAAGVMSPCQCLR